jgi:hypothetical protein
MKPQVTESSIDRVLARLLNSSNSAVRAFLSAAAPSGGGMQFDRVTISAQVPHVGTHGTADLALHLWSENQLLALILIENKIDAGFTQDQPARYAICRDAHLMRQPASIVATLLVSPSVYVAGSRLANAFDGTLSYERLLPFLEGADRALLELAIERAASPYEPVPVAAVMGFFDGYAAIVADGFSDLRIKANPNSANARPEASRTIYFDARASGFRQYAFLKKGDKPASIRVSHQCWDASAPSASVKLMLDGWAGHVVAASKFLLPALKGSGLYLRPAGRSLALVAHTKRLDNMRPAGDQRAAIEEALSQLRHIKNVWNGLEDVLGEISAALKP